MKKLLQKLIVLFVLCNFSAPSHAGFWNLNQNQQQAVLGFLSSATGIRLTDELIDQMQEYFNPSVSTTASSSTSSSVASAGIVELENTFDAFLTDEVLYNVQFGQTFASELLAASPISLFPSFGGAFIVSREELGQLANQSPEFANAIVNALDGASVRLPINGLTLHLLTQTLGGWNDAMRAFVRNLSLKQVSILSADIAKFKLHTLRGLICNKESGLPAWLIREISNNPAFKVQPVYLEPVEKLAPESVATVEIDYPLAKLDLNLRDKGKGKKLFRIVFNAPCTNCRIFLPNMDCIVEGENFEGTKFWTGSSQGENHARYYFKNKQNHPIQVRALGKVHAAHPSDIEIFDTNQPVFIHALHLNKKDQFVKDHCNSDGKIEIQIDKGLRKTQVSQLCDIFNAENKGIQYMTIEAATGSGKTRTMVSEVEYNPGQTTLILTPRTDLVSQIAGEFKQYAPGISVANSVDSSASFATFASQSLRQKNQVIVGTLQGFQTIFDDEKWEFIKEKAEFLKNVNKIIFDEAHYLFSETRSRMVEALKEKYPKLQMLFFTATPTGRKNAKSGKFSVYQHSGEPACGPYHVKPLAIKDAIDARVNAPFQVAYVTGLETKLHADSKEFQIENNHGLISNEKHHAVVLDFLQNGIMVNNFGRRIPNAVRYAIIFCVDIAHAEELTDYLNKHGSGVKAHKQAYEKAIHEHFKGDARRAKQFLEQYPYIYADLVHSKMKDQDVKSRMLRNRMGGSTIFSGADKLIEGYDNPKISLPLLMNPTIEAISRLLQSIGRAQRLDPNDPYKVTLAVQLLLDKRQLLLSSPQILGTMHHGTAPWTIEFERHLDGVPTYSVETTESKSGTLELSKKKRRESAKKTEENENNRQTKRVRLVKEVEEQGNEELQEELRYLVTQLHKFAQTLSSYTLKLPEQSLEMDVEGEKEWKEDIGDIVPNINVIDWDKGEMQVESNAESEPRPGSSMIFDEASSPSVSAEFEMDADKAISGVNDFFSELPRTKKSKKTNSNEPSSRSPSPSPATNSVSNGALRSLIVKAKSAIAKAQNFVTGCQMQGCSSRANLAEISSEVSDALGTISNNLELAPSLDFQTTTDVQPSARPTDYLYLMPANDSSKDDANSAEWFINHEGRIHLCFVKIAAGIQNADVKEAQIVFKPKAKMQEPETVEKNINGLKKIFQKYPNLQAVFFVRKYGSLDDDKDFLSKIWSLLKDLPSLEKVEFGGNFAGDNFSMLANHPGLKYLDISPKGDWKTTVHDLRQKGLFKDLLAFNGQRPDLGDENEQQTYAASQNDSQEFSERLAEIKTRNQNTAKWISWLRVTLEAKPSSSLIEEATNYAEVTTEEIKKLRQNFPLEPALASEFRVSFDHLQELRGMMQKLLSNNVQMVPSNQMQGSNQAYGQPSYMVPSNYGYGAQSFFSGTTVNTNDPQSSVPSQYDSPSFSTKLAEIKSSNRGTAESIKWLREAKYDSVQLRAQYLNRAIQRAENLEDKLSGLWRRFPQWQALSDERQVSSQQLADLRQMLNQLPSNNVQMAPSNQQQMTNQAFGQPSVMFPPNYGAQSFSGTTVNTNIPQTSGANEQDSRAAFSQKFAEIKTENQHTAAQIKRLKEEISLSFPSSVQQFKQNLIHATNYAEATEKELQKLRQNFPRSARSGWAVELNVNFGHLQELRQMMNQLPSNNPQMVPSNQQPMTNQVFGQPSNMFPSNYVYDAQSFSGTMVNTNTPQVFYGISILSAQTNSNNQQMLPSNQMQVTNQAFGRPSDMLASNSPQTYVASQYDSQEFSKRLAEIKSCNQYTDASLKHLWETNDKSGQEHKQDIINAIKYAEELKTKLLVLSRQFPKWSALKGEQQANGVHLAHLQNMLNELL